MYCAPPAAVLPDVPVVPGVPVVPVVLGVPVVPGVGAVVAPIDAVPLAGFRHPCTVMVPAMLCVCDGVELDGLVDCALRAAPAMASAPQAAKIVRSMILCLLCLTTSDAIAGDSRGCRIRAIA
jgi:hypothetical protein